MADETVVTELIIDARGAEAGSAAYVRAMKAAQGAVDRVIQSEQAAAIAMEKQGVVMTAAGGSISSVAKAWERLKASADPVVRSTQAMQNALLVADAASRKLGVSEAERVRVLDQVRLQHDAVARAADAQAKSYRDLAIAGREAAAADKAQAAINKTLGVSGGSGNSARASAAAFEEAAREADQMAAKVAALRAQIDPLGAAQATLNAELAEYSALTAKGAISAEELNAAQNLAKGRFEAAAGGLRNVGAASRLTAYQLQNLSRQGNDVITMWALGAPAMQIFASQAGQVFDALESGPQGALGSFKALGAGILSFVTEPLGGVLTAVTLAGGAMAAYALATRNDIKSADEVLKSHKTLIDEIAKAYPAAAAAAKKYEDQASKMPKSVIAADTADNVADAQKTLTTLMNNARRQMDLLNTGDGDFARIGKAGLEHFAELSKELKAGTLDAAGLQNELGKIRLDPTLSKQAHDFAKAMLEGEKGINKAVEVAGLIPANKAIKDIAVDGKKAVQTLADVAAGFKDTGNKASGADATIAKLFGDMSGGGSGGFGVTRSLGGTVQGIVGQFEQAGQAIQNMRLEQVQSMLDLTAQFRDTTSQVDTLKKAIATAGGKENIQEFFGDVSNIKNANSELQNSVDVVNRLFDQLNSGSKNANAVASGLDLIRQTLVNDGFGVDQVNKFIDSLIKAREQMDAGVNDAKQLDRAIQAIKNRTVTITVVTQQVGTGTKSTYDVGTTGGIGVARYGGTSDMTQQSYSVPSTGYGSMGGSADGGTTGVTVTRFGGTRAAGGPVGADTPYWVGEHGPELVVPSSAGSVVPNGQSMAMAQSGFTGRDATKDTDRVWTVLMNIEANTRKTYEGVEKWVTTSSYSSSGSSGGSSSGSSGSTDSSAYAQVLKQVKANFHAAGIVGGGSIGYGGQGLAATPEQIARAIVNGTASSVGSGGANDYENTLVQTQISMQQQEARRHKAVYGFSTGGMIGGGAGDTQKVEFFKRPSEKVIIADNDQISDQRSGSSGGVGGSRTVNVNVNVKVDGGSTMSKDSLAALGRQTEQSTRAALRSVYGR